MVMGARPRTDLSLPLLTIFFAGVAYPLGGFGLVYQSLPSCRSEFEPTVHHLYQTLPPGEGDRVIDSHIVSGGQHQASWCIVIRVDNVENRRHTQKWVGTMEVGIEKKILKSSGRSACFFLTHGGKTGRAMIKYPPYKKNAQPYKRCLYPGLTTVSLDRIINL